MNPALVVFGLQLDIPGAIVLAGVVLAIIRLPRAWRVTRLRDDNKALTESLDAREQTVLALQERMQQLEADLAGLGVRADREQKDNQELREQLAAANARIEEISRYTAQPILERLELTLKASFDLMAERDQRIAGVLERIDSHLTHPAVPPTV